VNSQSCDLRRITWQLEADLLEAEIANPASVNVKYSELNKQIQTKLLRRFLL